MATAKAPQRRPRSPQHPRRKAAPAKKARPAKAAKPAAAAAPKVDKPKKPKLVRDSFTIPKIEYKVVAGRSKQPRRSAWARRSRRANCCAPG